MPNPAPGYLIHPQIAGLAVEIASLTPDPRNARRHDERNVEAIMASYKAHGQRKPIVVQRQADDGTPMVIRAGNGQREAAMRLGWKQIAALIVDEGDREAIAFALRDNRTAELAEWDPGELVWSLDYLKDHATPSSELGWEPHEASLLRDADPDRFDGDVGDPGALARRFGVPPFTVLDARQGYWKERKDAWRRLGIDEAAGRENLGSTVAQEAMNRGATGGSVFDPVLAELVFRWFCTPGGKVLDPFAGESTKGIVASRVGLQYTGIELRANQVAENEAQARRMCGEFTFTDLAGVKTSRVAPRWICGDSTDLTSLVADDGYDLVFTSPPYSDLEIYSKSDKDGSAFETYEKFIAWYEAIMVAACAKLADNRFAVVKIGDVRDKRTGAYVNFLGDNIRIFTQGAGLAYYNEAVLITPAGSLPLRAGKAFNAGRKLAKSHQNILVFYKGDARKIGQHFHDVEFGDATA